MTCAGRAVTILTEEGTAFEPACIAPDCLEHSSKSSLPLGLATDTAGHSSGRSMLLPLPSSGRSEMDSCLFTLSSISAPHGGAMDLCDEISSLIGIYLEPDEATTLTFLGTSTSAHLSNELLIFWAVNFCSSPGPSFDRICLMTMAALL